MISFSNSFLTKINTYSPLNETEPKDFSASDAPMSRCISTAISLVWSEERVKEKGEKMVAVIKKVLSEQKATI